MGGCTLEWMHPPCGLVPGGGRVVRPFLSASHFKLQIWLRFFLEITPGGGLIIDICSPLCLE